MLIFFTIALVAFLYVIISSIAGHTHDLVHDIAHGDFGHDGGQEGVGHIISIFSPPRYLVWVA